MLVALCDPPPIAWLRVVAIDQHEPAYPLRKLISAACARLQTTDATLLACLSSSRWLDEALPKLGFTLGQEIVGMEWGPSASTLEWPESLAPRDVGEREANKLSQLTIRTVREDDFTQLVALEHAAFDDPLWWSSLTQMARAAKGAVNFDVAEVASQIVGFTFGAWTGRQEVHIVRIAVAPAARQQGIGAALLHNALEGYLSEQFQYVTLNTQSDNIAAHRLYERFGFRQTGDRFSIWVMPVA
jgi:ribosomal-protein-alanine N-acetyltransferase